MREGVGGEALLVCGGRRLGRGQAEGGGRARATRLILLKTPTSGDDATEDAHHGGGRNTVPPQGAERVQARVVTVALRQAEPIATAQARTDATPLNNPPSTQPPLRPSSQSHALLLPPAPTPPRHLSKTIHPPHALPATAAHAAATHRATAAAAGAPPDSSRPAVASRTSPHDAAAETGERSVRATPTGTAVV